MVVLVFGSGDVVCEEEVGWIRLFRTVEEESMYFCGEMSGEGARLEDGQESV
jgi:hypothetical protein